MVLMMMIMLRIVLIPGRSRRGIQRKSTAILTRKVATPIVDPVAALFHPQELSMEQPPLRTDDHRIPRLNRNNPTRRMSTVGGSGVMVSVSFELPMTGTSFPSFNCSVHEL